jgi:uncharacterized HAD superfamily protein
MGIQTHEIAFDFDGVVADTFRLFVDMAKKDYNVDIDYEEITEYDFMRVVKLDYEYVAQIFDVLTHQIHELDLKPNTGAGEVLTRLGCSAPPLSVVTARPVKEPVELWFGRHIPTLQLDQLKITATGVSTAKLEILKSQGTKYFVEDRLDTCHLLAAEGITPIIYDQPWNRTSHPYRIVKNWEEIASLIDWDGGS